MGHELIARFKDRYPSAMECLEEDLEECLTYLKFPQAHWIEDSLKGDSYQ